jgi:Na+-translocating ferredoxin:NAD+ oxidoreductase RnfE subunit
MTFLLITTDGDFIINTTFLLTIRLDSNKLNLGKRHSIYQSNLKLGIVPWWALVNTNLVLIITLIIKAYFFNLYQCNNAFLMLL